MRPVHHHDSGGARRALGDAGLHQHRGADGVGSSGTTAPGPRADPGDEPVLVPRPAGVALARGEEWVPPWADPTLGQVVARALAGIDELVGARVEPGRTTEVRVVLAVRPGLAAERLADAMRRATAALGDDAVIRVRVDSLELYPTSLV